MPPAQGPDRLRQTRSATARPDASSRAFTLETRLSFHADRTIFNEGDDAAHFYKVVSGCVRLSKMHRGGQRQVLRFVYPDDIFGFEIDDKRNLTAEAICATEVIRCPHVSLERLDEGAGAANNWLLLLTLRELSAAREHQLTLGQQSARERVASFLLQGVRVDGSNRQTVELPMSRQDVADFLGLTIETVCRELSVLRRKSFIDIPSRRRIVLNDIAALGAFAAGKRN